MTPHVRNPSQHLPAGLSDRRGEIAFMQQAQNLPRIAGCFGQRFIEEIETTDGLLEQPPVVICTCANEKNPPPKVYINNLWHRLSMVLRSDASAS
jgi:hypothetical protein